MKKEKKKKSNFSTVLLVVILFMGLSLLLYPTVSDYWNSFTQSRAIANYSEQVADMDENKYEEVWNAAVKYNEILKNRQNIYKLEEGELVEYNDQLNVSGSGIMGYIEIPSISCSLPIYHSTNDAVLQVAVGHIEWSSLPVGGVGTHCVLSGHRGLPSAKLFTDLDKLTEGDIFILRVLDEVLTYEVDRVLIVQPHETEALNAVEREDYCTLITCTPYGINSHRLLVRGHRIDNIPETKVIRITSDALQIEPLLVAPLAAAPVLLVLLIIVMLPKKKKPHYNGELKSEEYEE